MRNPVTHGAVGLAFYSILAVAGCDRQLASMAPTAPTEVIPPGVAGPTSVATVTPAAPIQSGHTQILKLLGVGFRPAITFVFVDPNGEQMIVRGSDVRNVVPTSADVSVTLWLAGKYTLTAVQANGERSEPVALDIRDRRAAGAVIDSVSPPSPARSDSNQVVSLAGRNFDPCLVVQIIDPDGVVRRLEASQRNVSTATLMEFTTAFNKVGTYQISLWTNVGPASSTVVTEIR